MIDIHSHILPGIDDGAIDEKMTLNMLRMAEKDGTHIMIATPHYYYPHYTATQAEVEDGVSRVNQLCFEHGIQIEVVSGREIMLSRNTVKDMKQEQLGSLGESQYLLVELSMHAWKPYYLDVIYELQIMGYVIIVAHPERYSYIQDDITKLNPLIKEGVIFQLDSGSITGAWGKKVQRVTKELIRQGAIQLIGSDTHSDGFRNPVLQQSLAAVEAIDPFVSKQMREQPYKILGKEIIDPNTIQIYQRKIFGLFRKLG